MADVSQVRRSVFEFGHKKGNLGPGDGERLIEERLRDITEILRNEANCSKSTAVVKACQFTDIRMDLGRAKIHVHGGCRETGYSYLQPFLDV